jgi:hypothetical protein
MVDWASEAYVDDGDPSSSSDEDMPPFKGDDIDLASDDDVQKSEGSEIVVIPKPEPGRNNDLNLNSNNKDSTRYAATDIASPHNIDRTSRPSSQDTDSSATAVGSEKVEVIVESRTASGAGDNFSLTIDSLGNNEGTRYLRSALFHERSINWLLTLSPSLLAISSQSTRDTEAPKAVSMPKVAGAHDNPIFQNSAT